MFVFFQGGKKYGNPRDCPGVRNVGKRWLIQSKGSRTENLLGKGQGKGEKERRDLNPCQRLKEKLTIQNRKQKLHKGEEGGAAFTGSSPQQAS